MDRKFEHERSNRRDKASKEDYREILWLESEAGRDSGIVVPDLFVYRGSKVYLKRSTAMNINVTHVAAHLRMHGRFRHGGYLWSFGMDFERFVQKNELNKSVAAEIWPKFSKEASDRFEMTIRNLLRADLSGESTVVTRREEEIELYVINFNCFIQPDPALNRIVSRPFIFIPHVIIK